MMFGIDAAFNLRSSEGEAEMTDEVNAQSTQDDLAAQKEKLERQRNYLLEVMGNAVEDMGRWNQTRGEAQNMLIEAIEKIEDEESENE